MGEKVRQSNFELLRILCMFGVLTSHSLMAMYDLQTANFSFANEMRVFVMNASCLVVNCFVMISGYFQIRQSWRGFIGLLAPCLFWATVCSSFALFNSECSVIEAGKNILFPLTETELWFIKAYFALYLIAPLLNAGINHLNDVQLKLAYLMLLVVDVYIGYIHQSSEVTVDGYHIIHFITLYTIAGMLRRLPIKTLSVGKLMGGNFVYCTHDTPPYV